MRISAVDLTVADVVRAAAYFADVLQLPVAQAENGAVEVTVGRSVLRLSAEEPVAAGVHHVAFDIPPSNFDAHRTWLESRVPLLQGADGTTEFEGPPEWNSRSLYFEGPDRMVLELIARRERPRDSARVPDLVSISEVGIAVPDVAAAVDQLERSLGATVLGSATGEFAPVGDHDGLLIVVSSGRGWLPAFDVHAQPRSVRVSLDGGAGSTSIRLSDQAEVIVG